MDYSKLSDREINAMINNLECPKFPKDYCNDPAAAWPIIHENGISVVRDYDEWIALAGVESRHGEADHFSHCHQGSPAKPLRSAMIVYLMMQESESE